MISNPLPGYDEWKTTDPNEMTEAEEREQEERQEIEEQCLRDAIAAALIDERGEIYAATVRRIVIEELNKIPRLPGEPEWQTKTPVPVPALG